jgi:hypothetical protein
MFPEGFFLLSPKTFPSERKTLFAKHGIRGSSVLVVSFFFLVRGRRERKGFPIL